VVNPKLQRSGPSGKQALTLAIAAVVVAATVVAIALGNGSSGASTRAGGAARTGGGGASRTAGAGGVSSVATVHRLLAARLHVRGLSVHQLTCLRNGRRFDGVPIVRCNANFGMDPHVQAYCSIVRGGRLVTNDDEPALPCGHDDAGYSAPVQSSG
jgi:hypothetical protein